jgi:hypothetical protein
MIKGREQREPADVQERRSVGHNAGVGTAGPAQWRVDVGRVGEFSPSRMLGRASESARVILSLSPAGPSTSFAHTETSRA